MSEEPQVIVGWLITFGLMELFSILFILALKGGQKAYVLSLS